MYSCPTCKGYNMPQQCMLGEYKFPMGKVFVSTGRDPGINYIGWRSGIELYYLYLPRVNLEDNSVLGGVRHRSIGQSGKYWL